MTRRFGAIFWALLLAVSHAAAAGSFLLLSPPDRPVNSKPDTAAPLRTWEHLSSYASLAECSAALEGIRRAARSKLQGASLGSDEDYLIAAKAYIRATDAKCVRSSDLGLR